jgi:hypothetical protein
MVASTGAPDSGSVLRADATFTRLPRPDYDIDARGLQPASAASLALAGAVLLVTAPFGAWLRVTRQAAVDAEAEIVLEVLGRDLRGGAVLVLVSLAALSVAALRLHTPGWARRIPDIIVATATLTYGVLLLQLQGRIRAVATEGIAQAGFYDLVPGAGWGAWAGLIGTALLVLSAIFARFVDTTSTKDDS